MANDPNERTSVGGPAEESGNGAEAVAPPPEPTVEQRLTGIEGQMAMLRHQMFQQLGELGAHLQQNSAVVQQQGVAVQQTMRQFQTGSAKRAMAAVFHKLFADLLGMMDGFDELLTDTAPPGTDPWLDSLRIAATRFEAILGDWGCTPIGVQVGVDEFDPEVHESAEAAPGEIPEDAPENRIVKVRRRGWQLHDQPIRFPVVVVS